MLSTLLSCTVSACVKSTVIYKETHGNSPTAKSPDMWSIWYQYNNAFFQFYTILKHVNIKVSYKNNFISWLYMTVILILRCFNIVKIFYIKNEKKIDITKLIFKSVIYI